MPLARKISLFFGSAVLATIAATLLFPWLHMTALQEQNLLWQARRIAAATYLSLDFPARDWSVLSGQMEVQRPQLNRELGIPSDCRPQLIPLGADGVGFQRDAMDRLARNAGQQYFWRIQDHGRVFRFAMAVRGSDLDRHPDALRGIIDLALPIARNEGVWSSVVTLLAGASGAVLAIIAFYMITQRLVLSPVAALRTVAEEVAAGDLDVRAKITSDDEFRDLSEAFNHMLAKLAEAQEEQAKINRSLDVKLGELAETNVALYEANRLKSEFLANVSHELRTPLVSIIGFAELLRDAVPGAQLDATRMHRYSENILSSGRSLLDLINDLLDLAKIEAGKLELHVSEFSIAELCADLADFVRPLADKRKQNLDVRIAESLPRFRSDSGRIKQILYNLLSNAVKFTPVGGDIFLTVERNGEDRARLIVSDTGPGIPPEQREAVFEKFRQLDSSTTREYAGSGLGLAITRDLVHILGGEIALDSQPSCGATFIVTLPTKTERPARQPRISLT